MTLLDLFRFFMGNAEAIRRLAADPWTPAVGAVLVLSAGLARHHDTHDLRRQWWRLLIPFTVSTLAAALQFLVVVTATGAREGLLPLGRGFLGLFWLTAPFAWLYGLPFERLWRPEQARRYRRGAVAAVAACRVALMTRCVGVLLGYGWGQSLLVVGCFAVPAGLAAVGAALHFRRRPEADPAPLRPGLGGAFAASGDVVDAMGVVPHVPPPVGLPRLEPAGRVNAGCAVGLLAVALLVLSSLLLPGWTVLPRTAPPRPFVVGGGPPSSAVWVACGLAVLFWVPWLVRHQPGQRRRSLFVHRLRFGPLAETMHDLAGTRPQDLPPHWDPSAALARGELTSRMLQATRLAADLPADSWVRAAFVERFGRMLPVWLDPFVGLLLTDGRMTDDQLKELAGVEDLLHRLPECAEILRPYQDYLWELHAHTRDRDPRRSEIIQGVLALALKRGSRR